MNLPCGDSTYVSVSRDNNLNVPAPIEEINLNLKPFNNLIKIAHLNAVSLPKYRDEISRVINKTKMDIIGISETNVKKNTPCELYKLDGYKFFNVNRENKHSGGVGIFVNNLYAPKAKKIVIKLFCLNR